MGTRHPLGLPSGSGHYVVSTLVIISVVLSVLVFPILVYWIGARGGPRAVDISPLTYVLVTMAPGILLGATSLLVMTGGD
jgi:hypothetical protein